MTAMIYLDGRGIARDDVLLRARRAATGFAQLGVREGDTVALLLRNDFAFFEAQQAAALVGAYCVPVNWHGKAEEVLYVLNDSKPKVLVAHADLIAPLRARMPDGIRLLVAATPPEIRQRYPVTEDDAAPLPGDTAWDAWLEGFEPLDAPPKRSRATMIYTSGTTGHPKGVKREPATPEQTAAYAEMFGQVYGMRPGVRALVTGPLYHASPNAYGRHALTNADVLVVQSKFDPEETLAAIQAHRMGSPRFQCNK